MAGEGYDIRQIGNLIKQIAGTYNAIPIKYVDVTIDEVLEDERCCIVTSCDGSMAINGLKVRYMPEVSDGDEEVPEKDSTAVIVFTEITEPIIVSKSWLSRKTIIIGNQSWEITPDKQVFNDGKYGGLATVKNTDVTNGGLIKRHNLVEDDINTLKDKLQTIMQAATTASAAMVTWTAGIPLLDTVAFAVFNPFMLDIISALTPYIAPPLEKTTDEMISNPNITHGKELPDA